MNIQIYFKILNFNENVSACSILNLVKIYDILWLAITTIQIQFIHH